MRIGAVKRGYTALLKISGLGSDLIGPIDLEVATGTCIAVRGPSGSGKSLFLRAVADLDPNDGVVVLDDEDRGAMLAYEWRRHVALVPAESGWWGDLVAEHFTSGNDPGAFLEAVGLVEALDWQVARLSTGERQRLAIARALCNRPRVLLLDEPTAALDQAATGVVEDLIAAQCRAGVSVVMITHDPAQAARLASRTYLMDAGRLRPSERVS